MKIAALIILTAGISISSAKAQGCYVEFQSPQSCSNSSIQCTGSGVSDANLYGLSIAQLCGQISLNETYYNSCESSRSIDIANLNDCNSKFASASVLALAAGKKADDNWALYSNAYAGWVTSYNALTKQTKLVAKLRRACGSRCRTIK